MTPRQLNRINDKVANAYQRQLTSFITDQKNITKLIAFLGSVGLTATMGNENMIFPIITGATTYALGSSVIKALYDSWVFSLEYKRQLLRDTEEYKSCLELYDSVVTDIAYFLRFLDLRDSLDIGLFYEYLLYNGFLSATRTFSYRKYSYDGGICPEIYGARISSGGGVCRHIATNLKDIYEKMGFTASYLSVGGVKSTLVSNIKTRVMPSSIHHAVVCVKDRYGKYIIDPTWEKVAIFDNGDNFAHIIGDNSEDRRYVIGYSTLFARKKLLKYDSYVGVRSAHPAILVSDDVGDADNTARKTFYRHHDDIVEFHYYIKNRLEAINYYEQQLSHYIEANPSDKGKVLKRG